MMAAPSDAQASNETGRAAGAEKDGPNASSEPELARRCLGKAAEDTLLRLCPSVLPVFPANFRMFPPPCPVLPFHAFCADKAEHLEVPSGKDVSHGLSLHDTLPTRYSADMVPQLGFGVAVPLLKSFCWSRQQLQAAGSAERRWDIKAQGGKGPHKP